MTGVVLVTPDLLEELAKIIRPQLDELQAEWEREGPQAMAKLKACGVTLDSFGGNCPVQAEGTVDGKQFYFRARGDSWQLHIGDSDHDIWTNPLFYTEQAYGEWPEAGWMPKHEAVGFIVLGVEAYRRRGGERNGEQTGGVAG